MSPEKKDEDCAEWLRSPLTEKSHRLQPMQELNLLPYFGRKRKLRLIRTRILLGGGSHCDIRIDDPFVSSAHAELRLNENGFGYSVHDLGSRNGIFLNGVRVDSAPLPHQGSLRIGRSTLTWCDAPLEQMPLENGWVVADPCMQALVESLRRVARSPLPVLLLGETGTGKDMLARMLHAWSACPGGPYVPVNGALTGGTLAESELFGHRKGAFTGAETQRLGALRSSHGGTLFLDEVADIPAPTQVKLLRALELGEVKALGADRAEKAEFRLISATSRDLEKSVEDGIFRRDLYYRLAGFVVHVPPLRERPMDILAISRGLAEANGLEIDQEAEGRLLSYPWPGNVRELRSCLERALVMARALSSSRILAEHLGELSHAISLPAPASGARGRTLRELERQIVLSSLERNGWSRMAAARELGIARSSLHGKMRRFGLRDGAVIQKEGKTIPPQNYI